MANAPIVGQGETFLAGGNGADLIIAEPLAWTGTIQPVNGSQVAGTVHAAVSSEGLRVQVDATGLDAGQTHQMHIHGALDADGAPTQSSALTISADLDHDGFIELAEAQRAAGPPILTLQPAVGATVNSDQTIPLDQLPDGLLPLEMRGFEVHGGTVAAGAGAGTGGEVDGTAGYKPTLPVGSAAMNLDAAATPTATQATGSTMVGGNGPDQLFGGHGADVLVGGNGKDVLAGMGGDDDLVGGRGADTFLVGYGKDAISDFRPAEGDKVAFAHSTSAGLVVHDTNQGTWIIEGDGQPSDPGSQGVLLVGLHAQNVSEVAGWLV